MKYYKIRYLIYGEEKEIIIKSENIFYATKNLKNKIKDKFLILNIEETNPPLDIQIKELKRLIFNKKKINLKKYYMSLKQISSLVKAGISLKDCLYEVGNNTNDQLLKNIFTGAAAKIEKGDTILKAFSGHEKTLGLLTFSILKLSEKTGDIVKTFDQLGNIYEKLYLSRKMLKKALRYPIIVTIAIIIAFVLLMLLVVPKFEAIFKTYGAELPLPSKILLWSKDFLVNYGIYLGLFVLIVLFLTIFLYNTNYKFKYKLDEIFLKLPLIGKLIYFSTLSQIFMLLYNLTESGTSFIEAIKITISSINNEIIKDKLKLIYNELKTGKNIYNSFEKAKLLDNLTLSMLRTGEKAGEIPNMLSNIENYYTEKKDNIIENIGSYIEPIMLFFIASMVLLIALGVFLPMWNMSKIVH